MKLSLRGILLGLLGAAALSLSPFAMSAAEATPSEGIVLDAHRVQIVHAEGYDEDSTNFNITFTNFGDYGRCNYGDNAIASGIDVALSPDTCEETCNTSGNTSDQSCMDTVDTFPFSYFIGPFVAHTVNKVTYGTFFGLNPVDVGPGTVSARIVLLPVPSYGCGTWELNVEATGLDLSSIQYNPMSIWLNDANDSGPYCFNIYDAIIGNQIPRPETPVVRRGVRR
jgi:hypothetical protein